MPKSAGKKKNPGGQSAHSLSERQIRTPSLSPAPSHLLASQSINEATLGSDSKLFNSPATRWSQLLEKNNMKSYALPIILLFAAYVRWCVALSPYSGYKSPPMYGDYEAQRHWMELTIHLPFSEWYRYDLQWWGLDYPPLTAYVSWLCGIIGSFFNPEWFALDESRGFESSDSKLFMRSTVMVFDFLIYVPAVVMYARARTEISGWAKKNAAILLVLLQPNIIIIDHGHFQYNSVMLGLTLWAVYFFITDRHILGSIAFCLSLGFKQMALYYSPAVFAFLLGKCVREPNGFFLFIKIGFTVLASFALLFAPWLTTLDDFLQSLHRIFPFSRGLYEDKVANFWCALNVAIKLRELFDIPTLARLSLLLTLLTFLPACVVVFMKPTAKNLIYGLAATSMAFFLFSFQVHEKSILLPALPITLLVIEEPEFVGWFGVLSMFSMYPLLSREHLSFPSVTLTLFWIYLGNFVPSASSPKTFKYVLLLTYVLLPFFVIFAYALSPPARYPDLHTVLNVLISTSGFMVAWGWVNFKILIGDKKDKGD